MITLLSRTRKPPVILFCLCLIMNPVLYAQSTASTIDFDPPEIQHLTDISMLSEGQPASISATVRDNVGVESVVLHFRHSGEEEYTSRAMLRSGLTDLYIVTLEPKEVVQPGLDYYLEATDTTGNAVLEGFPLLPLTLPVGATTTKQNVVPDSISEGNAESGISKKSWLWIGLGVLAAGALAASGGGGSSGSEDSGLIVEIPKP